MGGASIDLESDRQVQASENIFNRLPNQQSSRNIVLVNYSIKLTVVGGRK
jgi:hypothetical protein